jgi:starch phosphorylase
MDLLRKLEPQTELDVVLQEFMKIKRKNKTRLVKWVREHCNVEIDPDSLFDV